MIKLQYKSKSILQQQSECSERKHSFGVQARKIYAQKHRVDIHSSSVPFYWERSTKTARHRQKLLVIWKSQETFNATHDPAKFFL